MSYENQYNETYQKMRKAYQKAEKTDENKDWEVYRCYVEEIFCVVSRNCYHSSC